MNDQQAIEKVRSDYTEHQINASSIIVEIVTDELLGQMLLVCDNKTYMEEHMYWYDDETDPERNTWIDVEGEGYGWAWLSKPEEEWHHLMRDLLLEYIREKTKQIKEKEEKVIVVVTETKTIYHFIERESQLRDTVYTFSNEELLG